MKGEDQDLEFQGLTFWSKEEVLGEWFSSGKESINVVITKNQQKQNGDLFSKRLAGEK